jgi:ketosteroid isomerase-like protein
MPDEREPATEPAAPVGDALGDAAQIRASTAHWVALWSPGSEPFGADRFERFQWLFAQSADELLVFDDFGGTVTTITSWAGYIETWVPVMQGFASVTIVLVGEPRIVVAGELALSTFKFQLDASTREGAVLSNFTYATHVWRRSGGSWRIVHEHLTGSER